MWLPMSSHTQSQIWQQCMEHMHPDSVDPSMHQATTSIHYRRTVGLCKPHREAERVSCFWTTSLLFSLPAQEEDSGTLSCMSAAVLYTPAPNRADHDIITTPTQRQNRTFLKKTCHGFTYNYRTKSLESTTECVLDMQGKAA